VSFVRLSSAEEVTVHRSCACAACADIYRLVVVGHCGAMRTRYCLQWGSSSPTSSARFHSHATISIAPHLQSRCGCEGRHMVEGAPKGPRGHLHRFDSLPRVLPHRQQHWFNLDLGGRSGCVCVSNLFVTSAFVLASNVLLTDFHPHFLRAGG
jgi:hypothetical protein